MKSKPLVTAAAILFLGIFAAIFYALLAPVKWSDKELKLIQSLALNALPPIPSSPSNKVADNPDAAKLGQQIFFDARFSRNGKVSCATCHKAALGFTDGLARGVGIDQVERNTMSLIGIAYSPWFFWDGRKDSLWAQALEPLENPVEHGGTRMQYVHLIAGDGYYKAQYQKIFAPLPDFLRDRQRFPYQAGPVANEHDHQAWVAMAGHDREIVTEIFVNIGKALAAYQRQLMPAPTRFDRYAAELALNGDSTTLSQPEQRGLKLFLGKAQCINCHNGPLFSNFAFHNTGVLSTSGLTASVGRAEGLAQAQSDPFNCFGKHNDNPQDYCAELRFAGTGDSLIGAQKTPSLRNIFGTEPYMNSGQIKTLEEVIEHYNEAKPAMVGHNEAEPLSLTISEKADLLSFLRTLEQ